MCEQKPMNEETLTMIREKARATWSGDEGDSRAERVESFLRSRVPEYAEAFGLAEHDVLEAMEKKRTYCVCNYYQEANFPSLDGVVVFDTMEDLKPVVIDRKFRCPACKGVSTDPYECDTDLEMSPGKICDWKAYGFLGTAGHGLRFTVREKFLEHGKVDEIFMPVSMEKSEAANG